MFIIGGIVIMVKNIKLEYQALRYAQKTQHKVFTHIFNGLGDMHFKSDDLEHPTLVLFFNKATQLIYDTIKSRPVEYYIRSYSGKYGKGVIPKELIKWAYDSAVMDEKGLLRVQLDFSKDSLMRKYLGQPEVRVIDDFIFNDTKMSTLQCAFFHLFNTRLQDDKWCAFTALLKYTMDDKKLTFDQFKKILDALEVFKKEGE